jgi:hypothetical protein
MSNLEEVVEKVDELASLIGGERAIRSLCIDPDSDTRVEVERLFAEFCEEVENDVILYYRSSSSADWTNNTFVSDMLGQLLTLRKNIEED